MVFENISLLLAW